MPTTSDLEVVAATIKALGIDTYVNWAVGGYGAYQSRQQTKLLQTLVSMADVIVMQSQKIIGEFDQQDLRNVIGKASSTVIQLDGIEEYVDDRGRQNGKIDLAIQSVSEAIGLAKLIRDPMLRLMGFIFSYSQYITVLVHELRINPTKRHVLHHAIVEGRTILRNLSDQMIDRYSERNAYEFYINTFAISLKWGRTFTYEEAYVEISSFANKIFAITASDTHLYVASGAGQSVRIYKIDPDTGEKTQLGNRSWGTIKSMTAHNTQNANKLFVLMVNTIYVLDTRTGDVINEWRYQGTVTHLCGQSPYNPIYMLRSDHLYSIDSEGRDRRVDQIVEGVRKVVGSFSPSPLPRANDFQDLYVVNSTRELLRMTVRGTVLEKYNGIWVWNDSKKPMHMTIYGDKVFAIENNTLHEINNKDGRYSKVSRDGFWVGVRGITHIPDTNFILNPPTPAANGDLCIARVHKTSDSKKEYKIFNSKGFTRRSLAEYKMDPLLSKSDIPFLKYAATVEQKLLPDERFLEPVLKHASAFLLFKSTDKKADAKKDGVNKTPAEAPQQSPKKEPEKIRAKL